MFDTLFTDAEKVMFVKRIALILMLAQGVSVYAIARSLRVSETTVQTHKEKFDAGQYDAITSITRKRSFNWDEFFEIADVLLRLGMPSYGKDRWKWLK